MLISFDETLLIPITFLYRIETVKCTFGGGPAYYQCNLRSYYVVRVYVRVCVCVSVCVLISCVVIACVLGAFVFMDP